VLLRGHLHPALLLLRFLDALQRAIVPAALGVLIEPWLLALAAFLFLVQVGYALARYLTFQYVLTPDELVLREGILERQERRIPVDRIQDLGFESTILRRVLGLVVVAVETASGQGAEAQLDSLGRAEGERLRDVLLQARAQRAAGAAAGTTAAAAPGGGTPPPALPALPALPEWLVFQSRGAELLLRGLTDLRFGAIVVTGFAALQLADQLGLGFRLRGVADSFFAWLGQFPVPVVAGMLALLLFTVVGVGVVTSAIGNLIMFHGFRLTLRGDVLQRRYGLLTTRSKALPRPRIQRVAVEQTWLRRLLELAVVKADSAGSSRAEGAEAAGGFDTVVPLARRDAALAVVPALLPGIERTSWTWQRASRRLVLRVTLEGVLAAAIVVPAAWPFADAFALFGLLLVPLSFVVGMLAWGNLAWACSDEFLTLRSGVIGRYQSFVPSAKVQAVVLQSGPLAQLLGLAAVTVYVAGGSPTRLPDLTRADAVALQAQLARAAAIAAAQDWRPLRAA
jgi:putative membrane protein